MKILDKIFNIDKRVDAKLKQWIEEVSVGNVVSLYEGSEKKYSQCIDKTGKGYGKLYAEEIYVYGCVYLISNTIAKLPLKIYRKIKNDKNLIEKQDITHEHPVSKLFQRPNFRDSFYDLKEQISSNLELTGNAYLLLDGQDSRGRPEQIYCLNSRYVSILQIDNAKNVKNIDNIIKGYEYANNVTYTTSQIIHERKYAMGSEVYGQSPLMVACQLLDTTREARNMNTAIFSRGLSGEMSFETEQPYNDILYKRLKQDIYEKYQGRRNYHEPYILFGGLKLKNIGVSQRDLDFIRGMKLNREEICGFIYQVPLILLGVLENSSYNNIKEATKIFYNFSIKPRLVKIEEMFQKLIDLYDVEGAYCEFDLSNVEELRENISEKIKSAQDLFNIGIPLNQIISALNLPFSPVEGGDVGYIPFSVMPMKSSAGKEETSSKNISSENKMVIKVEKLDEVTQAEKWLKYVEKTEDWEKIYKVDMVKYFLEQKRFIVNNLKKYKSIHIHNLENNFHMLYGREKADDKDRRVWLGIEELLFDDNAEIRRKLKITLPVYAKAIKGIAEEELARLGVIPSFDVKNPEVEKWIESYGLEKCKTVISTLKEKIKTELVTAVKNGESISQIEERINSVYVDYTSISAPQLERIARTEVNGASNQGALLAYKKTGIKYKGWLCALDERTRETHIEAMRRYASGIPIDEHFSVGADSMLSPGQGDLPEENINCRCVIIPVVKEEE